MIAQDVLVRRLILVLANALDSLVSGQLQVASEAPAAARIPRTNGSEATHAEATHAEETHAEETSSTPASDGPEPSARYSLRYTAQYFQVTDQTVRKWAKHGELGEITYETIKGKQRMMIPGEGIIARMTRESNQPTA